MGYPRFPLGSGGRVPSSLPQLSKYYDPPTPSQGGTPTTSGNLPQRYPQYYPNGGRESYSPPKVRPPSSIPEGARVPSSLPRLSNFYDVPKPQTSATVPNTSAPNTIGNLGRGLSSAAGELPLGALGRVLGPAAVVPGLLDSLGNLYNNGRELGGLLDDALKAGLDDDKFRKLRGDRFRNDPESMDPAERAAEAERARKDRDRNLPPQLQPPDAGTGRQAGTQNVPYQIDIMSRPFGTLDDSITVPGPVNISTTRSLDSTGQPFEASYMVGGQPQSFPVFTHTAVWQGGSRQWAGPSTITATPIGGEPEGSEQPPKMAPPVDPFAPIAIAPTDTPQRKAAPPAVPSAPGAPAPNQDPAAPQRDTPRAPGLPGSTPPAPAKPAQPSKPGTPDRAPHPDDKPGEQSKAPYPQLPFSPPFVGMPGTGTGTGTGTQPGTPETPTRKFQSPCTSGCNQRLDDQGTAANEKLDKLLDRSLQGADLSLLAVINAKLGPQLPNGGISGFLKKFWDATRLDRVLAVFTWIGVLHNAYMLSNGISQTLFSAISNGLASFGVTDADGNPLEIGQEVAKWSEGFFKSIFGVQVVDGIKSTWKKYNRIYQAAANIVWSIQSITYSILEALETIGQWVAKIGNAARKYGVFAEKAFNWMNPNVQFSNNRFFNALNKTQEAVEVLDTIAGETLNIAQTSTELAKQVDEFDKAVKGESATGQVVTQPSKTPEHTATATAAAAATAISLTPVLPKESLSKPE